MEKVESYKLSSISGSDSAPSPTEQADLYRLDASLSLDSADS